MDGHTEVGAQYEPSGSGIHSQTALELADCVSIERNQIAETDDYNFDGLLIRLAHAVKTIQAKRLLLDSVEALFSGIADTTMLRSELRRIFR